MSSGLSREGGAAGASLSIAAGFDSRDTGVVSLRLNEKFVIFWRIYPRIVGPHGEEIGAMLECWRRASTGAGQVLLLEGPAGIGKSRLVHEFRRSLADARLTHVEGRCTPHTASAPLHVVIECLEDEFGLIGPFVFGVTTGSLALFAVLGTIFGEKTLADVGVIRKILLPAVYNVVLALLVLPLSTRSLGLARRSREPFSP